MKRVVLLLSLVLMTIGATWAQCHITVLGDFESVCIYDYKDLYSEEEYDDLLVACKNSTVTYTAHLDFITSQTVTYSWAVTGDVSHSASGDQLTVTWGGGEWGVLVVTATYTDGNGTATCTYSVQVKLIDAPTAVATTLPAYTVTANGDKVIRVCPKGIIEFLDQSQAPGADIAGILWQVSGSSTSSTSTPNFTLDSYADGDVVTHRVYNNCGCYDEETFLIEVRDGTSLDLKCYGTVCEGDTVTYTANAPTCSDYYWYVDGGTLIGGQGTASPTVQWDRPHDGYGILGLDGTFCDEACPVLMSRKIPVIHSGLTIQGETEVCEGEAVLYRLPLFGSTKYDWEITPLNGVDDAMVTHGNEARIIFLQAGTYTIRVSYRCEFLDCGPHEAAPLTVTVKPKFAITGDEQLCLGNPCTLSTAPAVTAIWHVYALDNGNQPVGSATTGTTYIETLSSAGRYLITAEHPDYCGPATFVLTVKNPPAPPTVADLSPDNPHTACPYSGIALSGTPSNPDYSLVWMPACSTATPQQYSGDQVNIDYQADVCNVNVYYYDHRLGCMSTTPYVHTVSALTPASLTLPSSITACPNTVITWGNAEVPDQRAAGMLYEWSIQNDKQYCASVQGSHLENSVTLALNEVTLPESFTVSLTRTWCGMYIQTTTVQIVEPLNNTQVSISGADVVCEGNSATYSGSGGNSAGYIWEACGSVQTGVASITPTFTSSGTQEVQLTFNPYNYCTNSDYFSTDIKTVMVASFPEMNIVGTSVLSIQPTQSNCTYVWRYKPLLGGSFTVVGTSSTLNSLGDGVYECTITNTLTGCTETLLHTKSSGSMNVCDELIVTHGTFDYCTHTMTVSATNPTFYLYWTVTGNGTVASTSGTNNSNVVIAVGSIGYYTVKAHGSDPMLPQDCEKGETSFMVDFLPNFTLNRDCDKIVIDNHSKYLDASMMVYLDVKNLCSGLIEPVFFTASQESYVYNVPTFYASTTCDYEVYLTQVGSTVLATPCYIGTVSAGKPSRTVSISTDNTNHQHQTCDNTPIGLTATLSSGTVASSLWNFSDGSTYETSGGYICHTFKYPHTLPYFVTSSVTDHIGCQYTSSPFFINSHLNPFSGAYLDPTTPSVCPGNNNDVTFMPNIINTTYQWCAVGGIPAIDNNPHAVQYPDNYYAMATNSNYCKKEATGYVGFLNVPTARIRTDQAECCVGETVTLDGTVHNSVGNVTYTWSVLDPNNTVVPTAATPSISFAASVVGIYTATLTVTGSNSCSTQVTQTINVRTPAAAPTLAFGANQCLGNGPVDLVASGYPATSTLHWSNGTVGATTQYYTYGYAKAYYYDPSDGCPSGADSILIERQPDFDALLTGCYEKCKGNYELPVYGLTNTTQMVGWEWWRDNTQVSFGSGVYYGLPLVLPVSFGTHHLDVTYQNGNCSETSPDLTITSKPVCDCEGIAVTVAKIEPNIKEGCKLIYTVILTICNNSGGDFCFDTLKVLSVDANVQVAQTGAPWPPLPDGDCEDYTIKLTVSSLEPMSVLLQLVDTHCLGCVKKFSVSLPVTDCEVTIREMDLWRLQEPASDAVVFYGFKINLPSECGNVLAVYSEPPMITGYNYDGTTGIMTGTGMLDMALLTQLAADGEELCFHVIMCCEDKLCKYTYCVTADELRETIGAKSQGEKGGPGLKGDMGALPALQPNPTTGEVRVTGAKDEVTEVAVLDMHGRQMALHRDSERFNVASLPSGTYIVRLKVRDGNSLQTYYLKLVKK
ncbi:MAG: T9SS type A sorting domain-containing protein [Bacteroidales bacterium]|nr:T9SS type A sorting domain-containing protein [Bacteroidales bacterium]